MDDYYYEAQQKQILENTKRLVGGLGDWSFPDASHILDARYGAQVAIEEMGLTPVSMSGEPSQPDPHVWNVGFAMYEEFEVDTTLFGLAVDFLQAHGPDEEAIVGLASMLRKLADEVERVGPVLSAEWHEASLRRRAPKDGINAQ